jgi:hypothetical protein
MSGTVAAAEYCWEIGPGDVSGIVGCRLFQCWHVPISEADVILCGASTVRPVGSEVLNKGMSEEATTSVWYVVKKDRLVEAGQVEFCVNKDWFSHRPAFRHCACRLLHPSASYMVPKALPNPLLKLRSHLASMLHATRSR